jgi:hypothetical protein
MLTPLLQGTRSFPQSVQCSSFKHALTALVIVVLALIAVAIGASVDAAAKVAVKAFSVHGTAGLHTTPLLNHARSVMVRSG